ncbi:MAG: hypothetical protein H0Z35_03500 [Thermoanaerobacteraceae bacterium]|nr:hypothetical protein [Thermoanaerobacteraceae bacterium]
MHYLPLYFLAILNYAVARAIQDPLIKCLKRAGLTRQNFRQREVPFLGGLVIVFGSFGGLLLSLVVFPSFKREILALQVAIMVVGAAGLADDLWGETDSKGFGGHLAAFFKLRKVTTGLMKAVVGGIVAVGIAFIFAASSLELVTDALLIALVTNLVNLFDLRPGRALKVFFLAALLIIAAALGALPAGLLWLVIAPALVFFPLDLAAEAMLGDVGANVLGVVLGIAAVWVLPVGIRLPGLVFLAVLHWYAEKVSFSKIISSNRLLRHLDRLGRE